MKLGIIFQFVGSLLPYIFPKQEFKPKRLIAVVVIFGMLLGAVEWVGVDKVEHVLDMTHDTVQLTTE